MAANDLIAITRKVGSRLEDCELTHFERQGIDVEVAREQHRAYEQCLTALGLHVITLPEEPELPDAVFVEDVAVVTDEVAVITHMGAESRRSEVKSVAQTLSTFRPLHFLSSPANLDGGDVMKIGRTFYLGLSSRTNGAGISQLHEVLSRYGYEVRGIQVTKCLHLKTGCSYLGRGVVLVNPEWVDMGRLAGFDIITVPHEEPMAANTLTIGDTTLLPSAYPRTRELLEGRGFKVQTLDVSELLKAEAGLTCMSIIFSDRASVGMRSNELQRVSGAETLEAVTSA